MARFLGQFFENPSQTTLEFAEYIGSLGIVEWHANAASIVFGYLVFYALTFACFEVLRRANGVVFQYSDWWRWMGNEAIGSCQMCVCSFAEASVWFNYGVFPFFIATGLSFTISTLLNQGAVDKPSVFLEEAIADNRLIHDCGWIFSVQLTGAAVAFVFSHFIGFATWWIAGMSIGGHTCLPTYGYSFVYICFCEFISSFAFRLVLPFVDDPEHPQRQNFVPWLYATFFTLGLYITGSRGVHLPLNFSRLACVQRDWYGVATFILSYIFAPLAGSLCASKIPDEPTTMRSFWRQRLEEEENRVR